MGFIFIPMGLGMRENGEMIYNMVMVLKHGLMGLGMRVIMFKERNKDSEYIIGRMGLNILGNGQKIKYKVLECIHG